MIRGALAAVLLALVAGAMLAGPAVKAGGDERARYADAVMAALREHQPKRDIRYDAAKFSIETGRAGSDGHFTMFLGNTFEEWRRLPTAERDAFVAGWVATLQSGNTPPETFEKARALLLPIVRGRTYDVGLAAAVLEQGDRPFDAIARKPLSEYHLLGCAIDGERTITEVTEEQRKKWGKPLDELLETARHRLAEQSQEPFVRVKPGFLRAPWTDSYAASRIAIPSIFRNIPIRGKPVVITPNRDHLYVAGSDDAAALTALCDTAAQLGRIERPITLAPIVLEGDRWLAFRPPAGHPLEGRFAELHAVALARDYEEQASWLMKKGARERQDVFASGIIVSRDPQGRIQTIATWTKGVPTLLPRADAVGFIDAAPDGKILGSALVRWDDMIAITGPLKPLGLDPERYDGLKYPDDQQLARLRAVAIRRDPTAKTTGNATSTSAR